MEPHFRKHCVWPLCVFVKHCVGHLMPAQCFLVFSTPRGVEHTHRRFTMKTCAFTGHPQITLECAIPYERQAMRWPEALRNRYFFHRRALR